MAESIQKPKWVGQIASVLSALVAIICPLCIPALGAFLASVGLGFAVSVTFLQPFPIVFMFFLPIVLTCYEYIHLFTFCQHFFKNNFQRHVPSGFT